MRTWPSLLANLSAATAFPKALVSPQKTLLFLHNRASLEKLWLAQVHWQQQASPGSHGWPLPWLSPPSVLPCKVCTGQYIHYSLSSFCLTTNRPPLSQGSQLEYYSRLLCFLVKQATNRQGCKLTLHRVRCPRVQWVMLCLLGTVGVSDTQIDIIIVMSIIGFLGNLFQPNRGPFWHHCFEILYHLWL